MIIIKYSKTKVIKILFLLNLIFCLSISQISAQGTNNEGSPIISLNSEDTILTNAFYELLIINNISEPKKEKIKKKKKGLFSKKSNKKKKKRKKKSSKKSKKNKIKKKSKNDKPKLLRKKEYKNNNNYLMLKTVAKRINELTMEESRLKVQNTNLGQSSTNDSLLRSKIIQMSLSNDKVLENLFLPLSKENNNNFLVINQALSNFSRIKKSMDRKTYTSLTRKNIEDFKALKIGWSAKEQQYIDNILSKVNYDLIYLEIIEKEFKNLLEHKVQNTSLYLNKSSLLELKEMFEHPIQQEYINAKINELGLN